MSRRYSALIILFLLASNLYGIRGPKIISPINGATVITLDPVFTWKPLNQPDVRYEVKIAEDQGFTVNVKQLRTSYSSLVFSLPYFEAGKSYYWTVRAEYSENQQLIQTSWAHEDKRDINFFRFIVSASATGFVGNYPVMDKPEQNSILNTLQPVFIWLYPSHSEVNFSVKSVKNEWVSPRLSNTSYRLEISESKDFSKNSKALLIKNDSLRFKFTIPWLHKGSKYYYRVKAIFLDPEKNAIKESGWSSSTLDPGSPSSFEISQQATGKFRFSEGLKEEIFEKTNLRSVEPITGGSFNSFSPAVSKDGQKLAFCSDRMGKIEIYEIDLSERISGSGTQKTTSLTGKFSLNPFWLLNNADVAFYTNRISESYWHIFNTTKGTGVIIRVADLEMEEDRNDFQLFGSCSSDGKMVFTARMKNSTTYDLYLMDLNTNTKTLLMAGMFPDIRNDDRIVYANNPDINNPYNFEIMVGNLEGNGIVEPTMLTDNPACDYDPVLSPDGTRIAFTSTRTGNSDLFVMDSDGSNVSQLTFNPMVDRRPQWVNNETLIFESNRANEKGEYYYQIYRIKVPKNNN